MEPIQTVLPESLITFTGQSAMGGCIPADRYLPFCSIRDITAGHNGYLWFTAQSVNKTGDEQEQL